MGKLNKVTGQEQSGLQEIAAVVRSGRQIVVPAEPEPMPYAKAAEILLDKEEAERREVDLRATFATLPYPGMIAFTKVLEDLFGFTLYKDLTVQSFFGPVKTTPSTQTVQVGPDEYREVVWADYVIPGTTIKLRPSVARERDIAVFALTGECLQRDRDVAQQIFDAVRKEIKDNSPLAGRAFELKMDGEGVGLVLDTPDAVGYMRTDPTLRASLILNTETHDQVETHLFTPVEHYAFAKAEWGLDMNRVALLAGPYGTGKSMTGAALASVVTQNGGTYIYLANVTGLADAMKFARVLNLPRVTIFAEDIDAIMSGDAARDQDTLANMISGVQSSTTEVNVVVTTNEIEKIHPKMIRRFNAVIEFQLPDQAAAARLIHLYGAGRVNPKDTFAQASARLAGEMPSLIKDTVQGAKLAAIRHKRAHITDEDLLVAAKQIETASRLAQRPVEPEPLVVHLEKVGAALFNGQSELLSQIHQQVV